METQSGSIKDIRSRLAALEQRQSDPAVNTSLLARVESLERPIPSNRTPGTMQPPGISLLPVAVTTRNNQFEAEMKLRIDAALAQATASIEALAARYASDADAKAARLEAKIKAIIGVASKRQLSTSQPRKRPSRRMTKAQVILTAQQEVKERAEAAAVAIMARYQQPQPKCRLTVHFD